MKRRSFLKKSAAASAAFTIVPSFVLGGNHIPPSDTLYIAAVGVGGRVGGVVRELTQHGKVKFVALCDVDDKMGAGSYALHPKAKQYRDFRKIYDNHLNDIDAIMVGTPDHTHATIALPFMREKKHAYVEKPLTHNFLKKMVQRLDNQKKHLVFCDMYFTFSTHELFFHLFDRNIDHKELSKENRTLKKYFMERLIQIPVVYFCVMVIGS